MKKFLLTIGFLFALAIGAQAQTGCVELREIDGAPDVKCVKVIRVTNGTLSCSGSTCTITISGGGGGSPGGADTNVQFNDSASFGGNSGFVYDKTSKISLGVAGASVGAIGFRNATSGTITLQPVTGALGTVTLSLPAATDTLVGRATTDTLSNKTLASPAVTGNISAEATSLLFYGSNYYRYINGTGPAMYDATTDQILTFNVQSLTSNRTVTWPDTALTVAGVNVANSWASGVKQTFAPNGTTAGFNVGSVAGDPSVPANGDLWYDSTANELTARINGANVALGAGSSGITVGTTTVTSGTATRLFYETAGNVVGQISGATSDGTNLTTSSGALRATSPRITTSILDTNGNTLLGITANASATEYITIANNTATNAVSLTASSPTVAASAQAGTPLNLTASPAIAGNVNVGAAAGGSVTITAGAAARLTSGNANGGDVIVIPGAGIGTGTTGSLALGGSTSSFPALRAASPFGQAGFYVVDAASGSTTMRYLGASNIILNSTTTNITTPLTRISASVASMEVSSGWLFAWSNSATDGTQAKDTWIRRNAAANIAFGNTDAASPVAQTLSVQNVVGGTSNTAGATWTQRASLQTGNALPGRWHMTGGALSETSGTTQATAVDRLITGAAKVLTNNSATTILNVTNASNTNAGGVLDYCVEVFDATDVQYECGMVTYGISNKGGVFSGNTVTKFGNHQNATSGTLTVTFAISAANPGALSVNANSSLTPSTGYPRITYSLRNLTQQAVAVQ